MGSYTGNYSNPNPRTPIILGITFKEAFTNISFRGDAVIDTGGDASNIPNRLIQQYNLSPTDPDVSVGLPNGTTQTRNAYTLEVTVPGLATISEEFVDYGWSDIVLGRTILNQWKITLDPSQKTQGSSEIQIQD